MCRPMRAPPQFPRASGSRAPIPICRPDAAGCMQIRQTARDDLALAAVHGGPRGRSGLAAHQERGRRAGWPSAAAARATCLAGPGRARIGLVEAAVASPSSNGKPRCGPKLPLGHTSASSRSSNSGTKSAGSRCASETVMRAVASRNGESAARCRGMRRAARFESDAHAAHGTVAGSRARGTARCAVTFRPQPHRRVNRYRQCEWVERTVRLDPAVFPPSSMKPQTLPAGLLSPVWTRTMPDAVGIR